MRTYWKDIGQSFSSSKGRLFSIFSLMGIGALALVALKVTTPNMRRTAQEFIDETNLMDLSVMADYGLDREDVKELSSLPKANVEFGYLTDVTIADSHDAVRIFSQTKSISQYQLVAGRFPKRNGEIALAEKMSETYQLGDTITFKLLEDGILTDTRFKVVVFVNSAEIWDNDAMGQTKSGTGELTGYGIVPETTFDSDVYMIARISYQDMDQLTYYQDIYEQRLAKYREELKHLLADNGKQRLTTLQASAQADIIKGYDDIHNSEKTLTDAAQAISDGKNKIADGQKQIDSAQEELTSGQEGLAGAVERLADAKAELDANADKLAQSKVELDNAKKALDTTKLQLDKAQEELSRAKATLDSNKAQLEASEQAIASGEQVLQKAQEEIYAKTECFSCCWH
ncbi:hypothetical protein AB6M97_10745 [Streptococcus hillyeri]|uniref:hypothetical protein n=1 Tax=Streptococcus hillyeri TaxID=2282420 RepID=UPI0034E293B3